MTYNEIGTPVRKVIYGEADIIYTMLTANHGRVDAIAKGIRKSNSRKRGNIEFGVFSSMQLAQGKSLDIITEAQMLNFNEDLLIADGVKFLHNVLPIVNRFSTDIEHSTKIFEVVKRFFTLFDIDEKILYETLLKYSLLDIQDLLPDWTLCSMCKLHYDDLSKYSNSSHYLICNNCARKVENNEIFIPKNISDIEEYSKEQLQVILDILNAQIGSLGMKL